MENLDVKINQRKGVVFLKQDIFGPVIRKTGGEIVKWGKLGRNMEYFMPFVTRLSAPKDATRSISETRNSNRTREVFVSYLWECVHALIPLDSTRVHICLVRSNKSVGNVSSKINRYFFPSSSPPLHLPYRTFPQK